MGTGALEARATDISLWNGSAWVSIGTEKVFVWNGASWISMNGLKCLVSGGNGSLYFKVVPMYKEEVVSRSCRLDLGTSRRPTWLDTDDTAYYCEEVTYRPYVSFDAGASWQLNGADRKQWDDTIRCGIASTGPIIQ